jgi:hypothetical protein
MTGSNIYRSVDNDVLTLYGGTAWNKGAYIQFFGKDYSEVETFGYLNGVWMISAENGTGEVRLVGQPNTGKLLLRIHNGEYATYDDLGGSAIVAKNFGGVTNYIKYASGLILQFGYIEGSSVTFPISFSMEPKITVTAITGTPSYAGSVTVSGPSKTRFTINNDGTANPAYYWFAVGR